MNTFVARQPIFDLAGEVFGYELLYRATARSERAEGASTSQMSRDVVTESFLNLGLERITEGALGFVNFSREMLISGHYELLPRDSVVIELLETVEADPEIVEACTALHRAGYRLALDDWTPEGPQQALLDLADIVKLDVLDRSAAEVAAVVAPLRARGLRLLAERVETAEVRDHCRALGFELFQGYFFSRPELVSHRGSPVEQAALRQLLNVLFVEGAPDE